MPETSDMSVTRVLHERCERDTIEKLCDNDTSKKHIFTQNIQVIRRNQAYFNSSNVSTDTTVIVKD